MSDTQKINDLEVTVEALKEEIAELRAELAFLSRSMNFDDLEL